MRRTPNKPKVPDYNTYEGLMGVKTLRELKEILGSLGMSEDILKKLTRKSQIEAVVRQFIGRASEDEEPVRFQEPSAALAREHPLYDQTATSPGDFEGDTHVATSGNQMVVSYTGKKSQQPPSFPTYRMAVSNTPRGFDPSIRRDEFPFQPNFPMVISQTPVPAFQDQRPTTSLALANIDSPIPSRYDEDFPSLTSAVAVRRGREKVLPTPVQLQDPTPLKEAAGPPSPPHRIISQREELDTPSPDYHQIMAPPQEELEIPVDYTPPHPFVEVRRGGRQMIETTPISFTPPSVLGKNTEKTPTGETTDLKNPRNSSGFPQSFLKARSTASIVRPAQPIHRGGNFTGKKKGGKP